MASFEQLATVVVIIGVVVTGLFTVIIPMNSVPAYHTDPSISSSQFAGIISASQNSQSQINQTISALSSAQQRNDPVIIFSMLSLLATTVFSILLLALGLPIFILLIAAGVLSIISLFVDISILIEVAGLLMGVYVIWPLGRIFGLWGNR